MADHTVFRSLREVFPQVDLRILKAVAIEHSKDVDAAVEFILSEVIPSLSTPSNESRTRPDTEQEPLSKVGINKSIVSLGDQAVEEVTTILLPVPQSVATVTASSDVHAGLGRGKSPCTSESIVEGLEVGCTSEQSSLTPSNEMVEKLKASLFEEKSTEHIIDTISDSENDTSYFKLSSAKTNADDSPSGADDGDDRDQLIVEPEHMCILEQKENTLQSGLGLEENGNSGSFRAQETISAIHDNYLKSSSVVELPYLTDYGVENVAPDSLSQWEQMLSQNSNLATVNRDLNYLEANEPNSTSSPFLPSTLENFMDSTTTRGEPLKDVIVTATGHEKEQELSAGLVESASDLVILESAMLPAQTVSDVSAFENALSSLEPLLPPNVATRSGHAVSIDFLEDLINDSKNNKTILASAAETARNMLKEVELLEERAKQAKEEASMAGQHTITKVDELKQMLKHAKEANDMHAGEVFGEKAILAAEARELQSRILNLSNEKNRYLPVFEEIRGTLEARLGAAQNDILTAEQEKLEKEDLAQKALHEQQVAMDKMVEESEKLHQQAEENSNLRGFLMDRGRKLDILQGEITVICENILSLKDEVEAQVTNSRFESAMASTLASSLSSSVLKSFPPLDNVQQPARSAEPESPSMSDQETPKTQVDNIDSCGKEVVHDDKHKTFSDDEWELFEAEV